MRQLESGAAKKGVARVRREVAFLPPLAFLFLSLLLYASSLHNEFVNDDKPLVAENRLIRDPGNLGRIFASEYWTTGEQSSHDLYRPLVVTTFALNYFLGGANPLGYHLVNLLLHAWVCWLVFRVGRILSGSEAVAWAGGLLFAVHPIHTEAVAPVVGRSEILAAGFFLWAFLLDRRSQLPDARRLPSLIGANACYLAALLSKENALIFPAVLVLTDLVFPLAGPLLRRLRRRAADYCLYLLSAVLYLGARAAALGAVARSAAKPLDNPLVAADLSTAFLTALITAGKYVGLLVWPLHLSADYSRDQIPLATGPTDPRLLGSLLALTAGVALAVWGWRRARMIVWAVGFYFLTILLVSNLFFLIGTIFGERLLYLPSVGFCLLLGAVFSGTRRRLPAAATVFLGLLLLAGSLRTVSRNRVWRDEASFVRDTALNAPRSAKAQHNLGAFLEDHGDLRGAESAYRRALKWDPDWAGTHSDLAGVLTHLGRSEEAIAEYHRAIALRPEVSRFQLNLGYALYQSHRFEEAVSLYREMLLKNRDSAPAYTNLGANLMALERYPEALEAYREAVRLEPSNPGYYMNLGQALARMGETERSLAALRKGVSLRPNAAELRAALGDVLLEAGKVEKAAAQFRIATQIEPGNPYYHYHLARASEVSGEIDTALAEYRFALKITPDAAPILRDLGLLLAGRGKRREAVELLRRAEALTPGGLDPAAKSLLNQLR